MENELVLEAVEGEEGEAGGASKSTHERSQLGETLETLLHMVACNRRALNLQTGDKEGAM